MFATIVALLFAANGLNVANSFVNRNLMSAIAERHIPAFVRQAEFTVAVFAGSTIVAVLARFAEERLGLLWRELLTERAVAVYMANGTYYRLATSGELANPDQRIAEDTRAFTATTLSFVLMATNSAFTILSFSGVLWSISPLLFVISVVYAALGSYLTIKLARPLVKLNSDQLDHEASFRSALIHIRDNAEGIMLRCEGESEAERLRERLDRLARNFRRIATVNRNVGFFSTGYNWLIQLIPILVIAPAFMRGEIEFGVITQSAMVFTTLVAAFSLVVTQFQSLSTYAAVVSRLGSLLDAFEREDPNSRSARSTSRDGRFSEPDARLKRVVRRMPERRRQRGKLLLRPLCGAFRPFIGSTLKVSFGSIPPLGSSNAGAADLASRRADPHDDALRGRRAAERDEARLPSSRPTQLRPPTRRASSRLCGERTKRSAAGSRIARISHGPAEVERRSPSAAPAARGAIRRASAARNFAAGSTTRPIAPCGS